MNKKLLIIGASGHGKVVADIAIKMNKWEYIAFLDDNKSISSAMGLEVIGSSDDISNFIDEYDVFVGIGNNLIRQYIYEKLQQVGANIPTLIHPSAIIGEQVNIGSGTVVMAGTIINSCTKIGEASIINTGATLDHDNIIENFVHISPGANLAGTVHVSKRSWIGIGSIISNNININAESIIGAGSVVIKDIMEPGVYVGVPVKKIKDLNQTSITVNV